MKTSYLVTGGLALLLAVPAAAQTTDNTTAPAQAAQPGDATAPAPMSDKDQAALTRCKALTEVQQAQSSKCTKLLKDSGAVAKPKDPLSSYR